MDVKVIKFKDNLAKLIAAGEKDSTWRLFDDKNLQKGDKVELFNKDKGEIFAKAILTEVWEKKMGDLENNDFEGHEKFSNEAEMYQTYRSYYNDTVGPDTVVKIIRFKLIKEENIIFVFIDASNLWQAQKAKGRFLDYAKIVQCIQEKFNATSVKVFYYTAYPAAGTRDYNTDGKHKFYTFLKKGLGFEVRKKELKRISVVDDNGESIQEKGNMDVEMTIDALHHMKKYDAAVFFTGDSDFLALLTYLKNRGKKVYVFSSKNNISQELRTGGDGYFDVLIMSEDIWGRELQHRPK